ncbi:MAG TPA: 2-oxoglutarate dehydrogenase complex dihydrolipoyllysine-residue succinyltransferase [Opitutaceae bacterium]|nr:2-oxoglutarate dehydrogenase complex dihydrolipoyllysine-residue succinyltransferase [Opitutaceae bacterium]
MATVDVKIPALGESITSGVLAQWHVRDGDFVQRDQPLYELETDKITSEGTAEAAGRIALKVAAGADVKIGQLVAVIETGERIPDAGKPLTQASAESIRSPISDIRNSQSPSVRRLAEETGVNPAAIAGSGPGGRVTKADMLAATAAESGMRIPDTGRMERGPGATPPSGPEPIRSPGSEIPNPPSRETRRKLTPLRQRLAQRLVQAQHQAAMLTTFNEVDLSPVRDLRVKYQEAFTRKHGVKLGFMSFFVKAVVRALQEVPAVNALLDGDTVVEHHYYDIGVAVSTDRGLMVPVLRDCERASYADVEQQLAAAAQKAREGKITLADLEGGVFTITNGGVFGSLLSTPILNAPQCAILGMHAIQDRPVAVNGQVVIRPMMYLALSYDHRIVDGREAVTFLVKIRQALESVTAPLLDV